MTGSTLQVVINGQKVLWRQVNSALKVHMFSIPIIIASSSEWCPAAVWLVVWRVTDNHYGNMCGWINSKLQALD